MLGRVNTMIAAHLDQSLNPLSVCQHGLWSYRSSKADPLAELISLTYQYHPWPLPKWKVPRNHKWTFPMFHTVCLCLSLINLQLAEKSCGLKNVYVIAWHQPVSPKAWRIKQELSL